MNTICKLLLASLMGIATCAESALIELNDVTYGAGALTLDTNTGYQWLDLTLTATGTFTYDSIKAGAGGFTDEGFRVANTSEVVSLLSSAGISATVDTVSVPFQTSLHTPVVQLQQLVGITDTFIGRNSSAGLAEYDVQVSGLLNEISFQTGGVVDLTNSARASYGTSPPYHAVGTEVGVSASRGLWMLRDSSSPSNNVASPNTASILLLGSLLGIFFSWAKARGQV